MSSIEFFTLVKEHLKEDGVMVVNMNMRGQKEGNINQYLSDTVANVFEYVYTRDVEGSTNRELFACSSSDAIEIAQKNIELLQEQNNGKEDFMELTDFMVQVNEKLLPYQKGNYMLRDDKAPVELLGMQAIDDIIHDEVIYYKDIYKKEGLKGLLQ